MRMCPGLLPDPLLREPPEERQTLVPHLQKPPGGLQAPLTTCKSGCRSARGAIKAASVDTWATCSQSMVKPVHIEKYVDFMTLQSFRILYCYFKRSNLNVSDSTKRKRNRLFSFNTTFRCYLLFKVKSHSV